MGALRRLNSVGWMVMMALALVSTSAFGRQDPAPQVESTEPSKQQPPAAEGKQEETPQKAEVAQGQDQEGPAPSEAVTEQTEPAPAKPEKDKVISGMSILGNQEAPKSLVIVPWKSSEIGAAIGISTILDDSRQPVDREVFMRALSYYEIRSGTKP